MRGFCSNFVCIFYCLMENEKENNIKRLYEALLVVYNVLHRTCTKLQRDWQVLRQNPCPYTRQRRGSCYTQPLVLPDWPASAKISLTILNIYGRWNVSLDPSICFLKKQLAWCNLIGIALCSCWPLTNECGSTLPWKAGPAGSSLGWLKDTGSFVPTKLFCFHFRGEIANFSFGIIFS